MTVPARSSRLSIRHVTGFIYDGYAESSYNEARMTPLNSSRQHVLEASLRTSPGATQLTYLDYFGSAVTAFDLHEQHQQLVVTTEAVVDVMATDRPLNVLSVSELAQPSIIDRYSEYLHAGPRTTLSKKVHEQLGVAAGGGDVEALVSQVATFVRDHVAYVPGSTHVTTTALESWNQKSGVCQDLSHLMISLLRGRGIPARYVSGYLHPLSDATIGETVLGQSHAWVEYFCGEWVGVDPTSGDDIGLQHVVIAKGRDYGDVPPLKGIYHGAPSRALGVTAEITKLS